jgi:hypothetical protein
MTQQRELQQACKCGGVNVCMVSKCHCASVPFCAVSLCRWTIHPLVEQLKLKAKAAGLWNLWMSQGDTSKDSSIAS